MRVADYIIERVAQEGVSTPFVVTGRGALFLTDALAKFDGVSPCFVHHEQSAAFAAVAAAQLSGKLAGCVVSTGCASTNTITGVLSAWQDAIPCVFISGQNTLAETTRHTGVPLRTYGQQEADIIPLVETITKYAVMLSDPSQVRLEIEKALYYAQEGRRGPVWIDVPLDIQNMRVELDELEGFVPPTPPDDGPKADDVSYVAEILSAAKRPAVLIGSGIEAAGAIKAFTEFVERNEIPVTYTSAAPDTYGTKNRLSIGSIGSMGCSRAGAFTVQNSDVLLILGSRLNSITTGTDFEKFAREAKVIVVDIDETEHSKESVRIDRLILSDVKSLLDELNAHTFACNWAQWTEKCVSWKAAFRTFVPEPKDPHRVDLHHLAEALSEVMPDDAAFICDSGFIDVILPTNMKFGANQSCLHPVSQGAMGYALPAVVGACVASARPVIAVVGDGSIMMNIQELQTIAQHGMPAKIFVVNNNAYAIIRRRQKDLFRKRTIGTDTSNGVTCPDFEKVAHCFGLTYKRIDTGEALEEKIDAVLKEDGPVLCEIMGLEDQEYIEVSYAKTESRKFVRRPLEDQAPFLDRDLFLKEMIIDPIDQ